MTSQELANWMALYAATAACCALAVAFSAGEIGRQLFASGGAWRRDGEPVLLAVPRLWWRWQKLYLCSAPATLAIVVLFGLSLDWR